MHKNDKFFVELMPLLKGYLRKKEKRFSSPYGMDSVVEDLIQDSYIVYKGVYERRRLSLDDNITPEYLKNIIFNILRSIYSSYMRGRSPRYFERLGGCRSLDELAFYYAGDYEEMISAFASDLIVETHIPYDRNVIMETIQSVLRKSVKTKTYDKYKDIFTKLESGVGQHEYARSKNIGQPMVIKLLKPIRTKLKNELSLG